MSSQALGCETQRDDDRHPARTYRGLHTAANGGEVRLAEHSAPNYLHVEADNIGQMTIRIDGERPYQPGERIFVTPEERHHRSTARPENPR